MKHILLFCFLPFLGQGQILLYDNFSDQDFSNNPQWSGMDSLFRVNGNFELQLYDSVAGKSYLSTPSEISANALWEFSVCMGFNPSTSNYSKIYLMSNRRDLSGPLEGYFLRIGGGTGDRVGLYRQDGQAISLVTQSAAGLLSTNQVKLNVQVKKDSVCNWQVGLDTGFVNNPKVLVAQGIDSTYIKSSFFGVQCQYTKTRAKLFSFDDFIWSGEPWLDSIGPSIDSIQFVYKNSIKVFYNEMVTKISTTDVDNFFVNNGSGKPNLIIYDTLLKNTVTLEFDSPFIQEQDYELNYSSIEDLYGNQGAGFEKFQTSSIVRGVEEYQVISPKEFAIHFNGKMDSISLTNIYNYQFLNEIDSISINKSFEPNEFLVRIFLADSLSNEVNYRFMVNSVLDYWGYIVSDSIWFSNYKQKSGDVVFSELMVDPEPSVGPMGSQLPLSEYIELYNDCDFYLNLENWQLSIGSKDYLLPNKQLPPKRFLVIAPDQFSNDFEDSISVLGLDMSSTVLTNSGNFLQLMNNEKNLLSSVSYRTEWWQENKRDGGWSVEKIDVGGDCDDQSNWRNAENEKGGTPGYINSVNGEMVAGATPYLQGVDFIADTLIEVIFSKSLYGEFLDPKVYLIQPELEIESVSSLKDGRLGVRIVFENAMLEQTTYNLSYNVLPNDCAGVNLEFEYLSFGVPQAILPSDLILNEVLFNPKSGGEDFVEIYNSSNKFINISELRIANWNIHLEDIENSEAIFKDNRLLPPKEYLLITENKLFIRDNYAVNKVQNLLEINELPSMGDDEGTIALANNQLMLCDYLVYDSDMHHPVLKEVEGVSLERITQDPTMNIARNWHSASSSSGHATPGYKNSQAILESNVLKAEVIPKSFTPNSDGFEDVASIYYYFKKAGYVLTVSIWNTLGKEEKVLENNFVVGQQGTLYWNGTNQEGNLLKSGIYIVVYEYFHPDGETGSIKKTCVLSR